MSIFEVMGPVMIGPSSSHTAGGVKMGLLAGLVFKSDIEEVRITMHGSFADTYHGHGTDRAVVAGILGFKPDDERIKSSLQIAEEKGIKIGFDKADLGDVHPNTAVIELRGGNNEISVQASSVGGGNILVSSIDNYEVNISGNLPALWILHEDRPGKVALITTILGEHNFNIAYMRVYRKKKGKIGSSVIELDQKVNGEVLGALEERDGIIQARYIPVV